MKTFWMIAAGICIIVAAVMMARGALSAAFVVAVLGMCAWALNYRTQVKESLATLNDQRDREQEVDSDDEFGEK